MIFILDYTIHKSRPILWSVVQSMKIILFWDVKIEAIYFTNIWLNFYWTTWCHNPEDGYLHRCIKFCILHSSTEESTATLIFMTDTVIKLKLPVLIYQKTKTMTKNNSWSMKAYTNIVWDSEVQLNTRENLVPVQKCDTDDVPSNCDSRCHISECMMCKHEEMCGASHKMMQQANITSTVWHSGNLQKEMTTNWKRSQPSCTRSWVNSKVSARRVPHQLIDNHKYFTWHASPLSQLTSLYCHEGWDIRA